MSTYRIDAWELCYHPLCGRSGDHLHGRSYGNPRFPNGTQITTTKIVGMEFDFILTQSGSKIELGEPHSAYEKAYPNARERLLNHLRRHSNERKSN